MDPYPKILSLCSPVLIAMTMSVSHPKSMFNYKCHKSAVSRALPTKISPKILHFFVFLEKVIILKCNIF